MAMLLDGLPPAGRHDMFTVEPGRMMCKIPTPRTLYGSIDVGTDFREWCNMFNPSLQNLEETVRLVTLNRLHHFASILEHVTLQAWAGDRDQWTGLILFPPPIEALVPSPERSDIYPLNTVSLQNPSTPPYGALNDSHETVARQSADPRQTRHFLDWKSHWPVSRHGLSTDPFNFFASVYESTWELWDIHCQILDSLVRQLDAFRQQTGIFDSDFDATGLHRSQRLKELVVRSQKMLSSIVSCIHAIMQAHEENSCGRLASSQVPNVPLQEAMAHFKQVQSRLEDHLPTIQHHVDVIIAKQQIELSTTQLMLSQQATAQADTVKRISILAFIFIPVSTASGIFGMNLRVLTPNPPVWAFATTAVCLMVATMLAAGWERVCFGMSRIGAKVGRHWIIRWIVATWWYYAAEVNYDGKSR